MNTRVWWFVPTLQLLAGGLSGTYVCADNQITGQLLTDPAVLTSLGFKHDARNVYVIPERLNQPPSPVAEEQDFFGTTASGFSTYLGQSFKPQVTAVTAQGHLWGTRFEAGDIYTFGNNDPNYEVQLGDIPNGARLQALRWWAFDDHATLDMTIAVHQVCQAHLGPGPAVVTVLGSQTTLGSAGNQGGEIAINLPMDTKTCAYKVRVTFNMAGPPHTLYKVRAQWVRQVSPSPATARFLDVPTNHPFFRFVEALAASGITGGCSPNQYCPDSPVTRGQMAVFLATALGLNWGGL